ncbi:hypothetical protein QCA50_012555 [Cerrena zonata]|uniref:Uncharacterized protein n=1 Tax=Cerrena zonata TaxID=2478898 RepID=A0AAW0FTW6_9APHY
MLVVLGFVPFELLEALDIATFRQWQSDVPYTLQHVSIHPSDPNTTSTDSKGNVREMPAIPPPKFTPNSPEARLSDSPSLVSDLLQE